MSDTIGRSAALGTGDVEMIDTAMSRRAVRNDRMIDVRQNGIGDIVVACWIVHSAAAVSERVRLNPRNHWPLAALLSVPEEFLTREEAADWSQTLGIGHQFEYAQVDTAPMSRFDAWCRSLELDGITPVRPPYLEDPGHGRWADEQWQKVPADPGAPRVLIFPDAAWSLRAWPRAYFVDLASELSGLGYAVAAMAGSQEAVEFMPCHWWGGFGLGVAAGTGARDRGGFERLRPVAPGVHDRHAHRGDLRRQRSGDRLRSRAERRGRGARPQSASVRAVSFLRGPGVPPCVRRRRLPGADAPRPRAGQAHRRADGYANAPIVVMKLVTAFRKRVTFLRTRCMLSISSIVP